MTKTTLIISLLFFSVFLSVEAQDTFSGRAFIDHDADGTENNSDYGHPVVRVRLFDDVNGNCSLDANDKVIHQTMTDKNGNYTLSSGITTEYKTVTVIMNASAEDAEQSLTNNKVSITDDALNLGQSGGTSQLVGLAFSGVNVQQGATITNAFIRFRSASTSSGSASLTIEGESNGNAALFTTAKKDISDRSTTIQNESWTPGNWSDGQFYSSPDLSTVVQEIVNLAGWQSGNRMGFIISGSGERQADAADADDVTQLVITYQLPVLTTYSIRVSNGDDDAEEIIEAGASQGVVSISSSDLEMVDDGADQLIGIMFREVYIPTGKEVTSAYIEFTADGTHTESTYPTSLEIHGAQDGSPEDMTSSSGNLSARQKTTASVEWNDVPTWTDGSSYNSPDLATLMNQINADENRLNGSPMLFLISGSGKRRAESYNGSSAEAPRLVYTVGDVSMSANNYLVALQTNDLSTGSTVTNPGATATYCVAKGGGSASGYDFGINGYNAICYGISNYNLPSKLSVMNRITGVSYEIGEDNDFTDIESAAFDPQGNTLYAFNGGQLTTVNTATGQHTVKPNSIGTASNGSNNLWVGDIDGMSFDPIDQVLWVSHRRGDSLEWDLLLQVDSATGIHIDDVFGVGKDYVEIKDAGGLLPRDIDDIAVNPLTGVLYGIANGGNADIDLLVTINKTTGEATLVDTIKTAAGQLVGDMEGFGFSNFGILIGSTGTDSEVLSDALYTIDLSTAVATLIGGFEYGLDYESCDCRGSIFNKVEGAVYHDADGSKSQNGTESGIPNVTVYLYQDNNGNGEVDSGDSLIDSVDTQADGSYFFSREPNIQYALSIDANDLPISASELSTDAKEDADFSAFYGGITDSGNDFGAWNAPLPVDLIDFSGIAEGCHVELTWTTENEEAFSHYELERSSDGNTYKLIKHTDATGGLFLKKYGFLDRAAGENNYYRLKMVDLDGSIQYSKVVQIQTDCSLQTSQLSVYPNPIGEGQNILTVKFFSDKTEMKVMVTDINGQAIQAMTIMTDEGWNLLRFNTDGLPSGSYFIVCTDKRGNLQSKKIVIQN